MTISATFANAENTQVVFTDNSGAVGTVSPDWPGLFRMEEIDGGGVVGFLAAGGTISPYVPPEPIVPSPMPTLYAVAQITVADGAISGIDVNSKFAAAFILDVGQYYIFFTETQPDTNYLAKAYDGGLVRSFVRPEDKATDYFIITVTDFNGTPQDTGALSIEVIRVS